jgi:hypothetical protein
VAAAGMPMESLLPAMAHAHDHDLAAAIYMSMQPEPGAEAAATDPNLAAQHMI